MELAWAGGQRPGSGSNGTSGVGILTHRLAGKRHMREPGRGELVHERTLAERVALIRVCLTLANFAIIWLDHTIPDPGTAAAYAEAVGAAALFFAYAATLWLFLRTRHISLGPYFAVSPILDVAFAALLILATEGYLSPFQLWFAVAVVSSGFGRSPRLPLLTAGLAVAAHCLIALVPQAQPLDVSVFAVRSGYLFGVAAVLSSINFHLVSESRALGLIAEAGRALNEANSRSAVASILVTTLRNVLEPARLRLSLDEGTCVDSGQPGDAHSGRSWNLDVFGRTLGTLTVSGRRPLSRQEEAFVRVLCDRAASALLRIELSGQLVAAARAEERLRLADELHDSVLQTLAALDLRAEVARRLFSAGAPDAASELEAIREIGRRAAAQIRATLVMEPAAPVIPDGQALRQIVAECWPGPAEVEIASDIALSEAKWRLLQMVVKEGLNNVRKHAGATRVSLRLYRAADGRVVCSLENDGVPVPPRPRLGYGLSRLSALTHEQGGRLSLNPRPKGGALLVAEFWEAP